MTIAVRSLVFRHTLLVFWLSFPADHCSHWLLENFFKPLTSQSTAFQVLALHIAFNHCFGCFFANWCCFWIFRIFSIRLTKIDFVAYKNFDCSWNNLLDFRIPLNKVSCTFLRALAKVDGYMTEKAMRKISVPGYARGLRRPNSSWPAVSLSHDGFTIDQDWLFFHRFWE